MCETMKYKKRKGATINHPPPATDSGRTARTPLYPPVQAVPLTYCTESERDESVF